MHRVTDLPDEMLLEIFSHLDLKNLPILARTNTKFHKIVNQLQIENNRAVCSYTQLREQLNVQMRKDRDSLAEAMSVVGFVWVIGGVAEGFILYPGSWWIGMSILLFMAGFILNASRHIQPSSERPAERIELETLSVHRLLR